MCVYIYIYVCFSWGPPAFFDLSGVSNASIQSAGAWVTARDLSAASDEDGVGILNASRCRCVYIYIYIYIYISLFRQGAARLQSCGPIRAVRIRVEHLGTPALTCNYHAFTTIPECYYVNWAYNAMQTTPSDATMYAASCECVVRSNILDLIDCRLTPYNHARQSRVWSVTM